LATFTTAHFSSGHSLLEPTVHAAAITVLAIAIVTGLEVGVIGVEISSEQAIATDSVATVECTGGIIAVVVSSFVTFLIGVGGAVAAEPVHLSCPVLIHRHASPVDTSPVARDPAGAVIVALTTLDLLTVLIDYLGRVAAAQQQPYDEHSHDASLQSRAPKADRLRPAARSWLAWEVVST
jgi:hypothetical protein